MLAALILAAGEARRYGGAKQLHPVGGRPMLEVVCATVAASGIAGRTVVLGARAGQVTAAVDMHGAAIVVCERWQDGQAASLLCGLESLAPDVDEALIVLGDGPWLSAEAIRRVAGGSGSGSGSGSGPRAADYGSGRSHPVVLPRSSWSSLPTRGETPGRTVNVRLVDCTDLQAPGDVDYSEA